MEKRELNNLEFSKNIEISFQNNEFVISNMNFENILSLYKFVENIELEGLKDLVISSDSKDIEIMFSFNDYSQRSVKLNEFLHTIFSLLSRK